MSNPRFCADMKNAMSRKIVDYSSKTESIFLKLQYVAEKHSTVHSNKFVDNSYCVTMIHAFLKQFPNYSVTRIDEKKQTSSSNSAWKILSESIILFGVTFNKYTTYVTQYFHFPSHRNLIQNFWSSFQAVQNWLQIFKNMYQNFWKWCLLSFQKSNHFLKISFSFQVLISVSEMNFRLCV